MKNAFVENYEYTMDPPIPPLLKMVIVLYGAYYGRQLKGGVYPTLDNNVTN